MTKEIITLAILIVLSAIFSGSETALISLTNSKVNELVAKKTPNSKILKKLKMNPHKLLITILVGNNIVNVGASAYAAVLFTDIFGSAGVGIATGVMTFFLLIFGEITPKSFAHNHSVGVSLVMARPFYYLQFIIWPIVWFFEKIVKLVHMASGSKKGQTVTEGELVAMLKIGAQEGSIEKQEQELIENVLEFNDIEAEEVMTPRVAIEALDCEMTIKEAVDFVIEHTHSRIPVYRENLDNIIGIITIKNLLKYFDKHHAGKKLKTLELAHPLEVPTTKKINKLFREFQRKHIHMAIIIDEYGGTAGLVTLEDLLEEIVGEIVDEFDVAEKPIEIIDKNHIIVTGETLVEDVNDFFRIKFWDNDRDSINSVILAELNRFPRENESVKFRDVKMLIMEMGKKVVKKVKITKLKKAPKKV
jgi:putative hemolysin